MRSFTPSFLAASTFAFVTAALVVGCSSTSDAPAPTQQTGQASSQGCSSSGSSGSSGGSSGSSGTSSGGSSGNTSYACVHKGCGFDCTPEGSDEPFNCNAKGECVATGQPLGCQVSPECSGKACGVDCSPSGSDEPFNCNAAGQCVSAGHALGCKQCPEFLADCIQGQVPADLDGDGCIDGCKAP
jgi:hypothetical protein